MKIWAISDLHGQLPSPPKPGEVDLAVIAGDVMPDREQRQWVRGCLVPWLERFPCPVFLTWGNHDFLAFRAWQEGHPALPWAKTDELVMVQGVRIYFSPWSLSPPGWAFRMDNEELGALVLSKAPEHVDVIVSHGPPEGPAGRLYAENLGYRSLHEYAVRAGAKTVICGHIHEARGAYGASAAQHYQTYNVTQMDSMYDPVYPPMIIEVEGGGGAHESGNECGNPSHAAGVDYPVSLCPDSESQESLHERVKAEEAAGRGARRRTKRA